MKRYKLPNEFNCPNCKCIMDAASGGQDTTLPKHDDFCTCVNCGEFLCYVVNDGVYSLRKLDNQDIEEAKRIGIYDKLLNYRDQIKNGDIKLKVRWPK